MAGLRSHPIGIQPTNLLINGKGTVQNVRTNIMSFTISKTAAFLEEHLRSFMEFICLSKRILKISDKKRNKVVYKKHLIDDH
jgi:hypothetical protein